MGLKGAYPRGWWVELLATDFVDDGLKGVGMIGGEVGQYFSVELYVVLLEGVYKLVVAHAVLSCCGVYSHDPKSSEVAFARLSIAVGIEECLFDGIFGDGIDIFAGSEVALGHFEYFLSPAPACYGVGCSWHGSAVLNVRG